jgi:hypothetical protein
MEREMNSFKDVHGEIIGVAKVPLAFSREQVTLEANTNISSESVFNSFNSPSTSDFLRA